MAGFPWQQQDAISDNIQNITPFPDGDVILEPYAYVSAADSTTHRPWFQEAGGRDVGSFAGLFGVDPANLGTVTESDNWSNNCGATALDFPTSFTFASRSDPATTTRSPAAALSSLPIGPYSSLVSPFSTGNHDFNFASQPAATTNHAHALHDSFFHQLDTPLDNFYHPPQREPLSSAQFNLTQQNHSAATLESSSWRSLIPPSQPPDLVATTTNTTVFENPNSFAPSYLSSFFPPEPARSAIQNEIASTGQPEGRLPDEVLCNNHGTGGAGGGSSGSANQVTNNGRNLLQPPNMPATSSRKRTRAASYLEDLTGPSASSSKRKTTTAGRQPPNASRAPSRVVLEDWPEIPDSDDLFGSDPFGEDDPKMFDLTKDDVQPGNLVAHNKPKEEDNRVRLAKFECIICMDSASNLTVTHCGMLSTHTCFLVSSVETRSNNQFYNPQATCSAHNVSTKPYTPKSQRRSVLCAGKNSTCGPETEAPLPRLRRRSSTWS